MTVSKDHYYRLGSEVPQERLEAAKNLLSELSEVGNKGDWDYALDRLTKGLTTTRQSARYGFSMVLTEVVRELVHNSEYDMNLSDYLKLVLEKSQLRSSMKGKEERAVLFGRLFGLQILINSELIYDDSIADESFKCEFISSLIELANMKSWLRETAIFSLCQMIQVLAKKKEFEDIEKILVYTLQCINDEGLNLSTEGMSVYLSIPKSIRYSCFNKLKNMTSSWKRGDPLAKGNASTVAKVLKDVDVMGNEEDADGSKKPKQKGSWNQRLPFVWDLIMTELLNDSVETVVDEDVADKDTSKKRKKSSSKVSKKQKLDNDSQIPIKEFWKVVVEESFFAEKASPERKYWGFEIFMKFLTQISGPEIESIFTPNFMRTLINQSSSQNRLLNKMSTKVLSEIGESVRSVPQKAPIVLSCLIDNTRGGCWNFDLVTKSKTIDIILSPNFGEDKISNDVVGVVLKDLKNVLFSKFESALEDQESPKETEEEELIRSPNENILKWILDKLLLLVRNNNKILASLKTSNLEFLDDILKFLIKNSFFQVKNSKVLSENIRKICIERLNSILAVLIESKRKNNSWSYYCVKIIKKLETSSDCEILVSVDEEIGLVKDETYSLLESVVATKKASKSDSLRDQLYCFELLFSMGLLQLYMEDEETIQMLEEIKMSYESSMTKIDKNEDTDSAVVQTEIILSFIARKSLLLKKISMMIWESLVSSKNGDSKTSVNEKSMQLLFDALTVRENKEGLQKLFEGEEEYDVDDSIDKIDKDSDDESNASEDDTGADSETTSGSDSESDASNDDTNRNEDFVSEVDKKTTVELAKALGVEESSNEVKFDELSSESDQEESDSMDDQQMSAMDDQLAKIFKERKDALNSIQTGNKRKEEVLEAKEQVVFFKNRVMDMLELFSKHAPNSYLNLKMIKPLLVLISLTLDKNLENKAHKLIKSRISKTKVSPQEFESLFPSSHQQKEFKDALLDSIKWIQKRAASSKTNQAHSLACNQSCIIVAKNLLFLDDSYMEAIIDIYSNSLKLWAMDPKNKSLPALFYDFINWLNTKRVAH